MGPIRRALEWMASTDSLWSFDATLIVMTAAAILYVCRVWREYADEPVEMEAQCPDCHGWSVVEWQDEPPLGGLWWRDSGACPKCGADVLVETECEFRERISA